MSEPESGPVVCGCVSEPESGPVVCGCVSEPESGPVGREGVWVCE